jgi:hypothetical protein
MSIVLMLAFENRFRFPASIQLRAPRASRADLDFCADEMESMRDPTGVSSVAERPGRNRE